MCGNHLADGTPVDHHHPGPLFVPHVGGPRQWRRRAFLGEVGKGTVAFAMFAPAVVAACADDATDPSGSAETSTSVATTTTAGGPAASEAPTPDPLQWARTDHGFVSSYVLVRGTEAAIVDTGVAGSADDIGRTLTDIGLTYSDVRHVFLTHWHNDHIGAIDEVLAMAGSAQAHAGVEDLEEIAVDQVSGLTGGETIFGLEMLATPGHTIGHISVIDHEAGILVAGDAMVTSDGAVGGPVPEFSTDIDLANDTVRRLARLSFNTLLVGHGAPIEGMADTAVADLAAAL